MCNNISVGMVASDIYDNFSWERGLEISEHNRHLAVQPPPALYDQTELAKPVYFFISELTLRRL
jgi:hypothetical protein